MDGRRLPVQRERRLDPLREKTTGYEPFELDPLRCQLGVGLRLKDLLGPVTRVEKKKKIQYGSDEYLIETVP